MEHFQLRDMVKGWFVGDIKPTALATSACEVAVKAYKCGDYEPAHFHKVATEATLILSGEVVMCGQTWGAGDIIVLPPDTVTDFRAVSDVTTVVVKVPGALNDKYSAKNP
jgi:quercetin dioxygenase-like cupin family protein